MKSLKFGVIALFLSTVGFIGTSLASDNVPQTTAPSATMQKSMMHFMQRCTQYKKLTADQKTKVDKVMEDCKSKVMPLMDQLMAKKDQLDKLFMTTTPDETAINSLVKEISDLHNQMFAAHIQARIEMAKVGFLPSECWKSMGPMMWKGMKGGKGMGMHHKMMYDPMLDDPSQGM